MYFFSFRSIPNNAFRISLLLKICSVPPKNIYLHCFQVVWIAIMGNADWKPLQFLCFAFFYRILQKLRATEPPITPIYNVRHFLMLVCHLMSYSVYIFMVMSSMMLLSVTVRLSKFPLLSTVVALRQK